MVVMISPSFARTSIYGKGDLSRGITSLNSPPSLCNFIKKLEKLAVWSSKNGVSFPFQSGLSKRLSVVFVS